MRVKKHKDRVFKEHTRRRLNSANQRQRTYEEAVGHEVANDAKAMWETFQGPGGATETRFVSGTRDKAWSGEASHRGWAGQELLVRNLPRSDVGVEAVSAENEAEVFGRFDLSNRTGEGEDPDLAGEANEWRATPKRLPESERGPENVRSHQGELVLLDRKPIRVRKIAGFWQFFRSDFE